MAILLVFERQLVTRQARSQRGLFAASCIAVNVGASWIVTFEELLTISDKPFEGDGEPKLNERPFKHPKANGR